MRSKRPGGEPPLLEICTLLDATAILILFGSRGAAGLEVSGEERGLEIEETLGHAAHKANELRLPLPLLSAFYHLVRAVDRTCA